MKIGSVYVKDPRGGYVSADRARARRGCGFGEAPPEKPGRELSFASAEVLEEVSGLEGLCVKKFRADLVTEGLDYRALSPGTLLSAGGALFEICSVGKRCFAECPLEEKPCSLAGGCAFGRVVRDGEVRIGDTLAIVGREGEHGVDKTPPVR